MKKKQDLTKADRMKYLFLLITALLSTSFYNYIEAKAHPREMKLVFANTDTLVNDNNIEERDSIYEIVDEPAEYPGGVQAEMQFLAQNINYPPEVMKLGIQGRIIAQMIIRSNGKVSDVKIIRSLHPDLDKEVVQALEAMPQWKPGKKNGKAVNMKMTIPVNFNPGPPPASQNTEQKTNDKICETPDIFPEFPGGLKKLKKYIQKHIIHWKSSQTQNEQSRVITTFIIREDGSISDVKVIQGGSPALTAEAYRIISQMPKWKPGQQGGKPVSVRMTLPINFRP